MTIAIPVSENSIDAFVDMRFGRCSFFCFYDTVTKRTEFKQNMLKNDAGGVGLKVSEFLANNGVNKVYALEFGPKAKDMLDKLKIETQIIENGQKVREIIELVNR